MPIVTNHMSLMTLSIEREFTQLAVKTNYWREVIQGEPDKGEILVTKSYP